MYTKSLDTHRVIVRELQSFTSIARTQCPVGGRRQRKEREGRQEQRSDLNVGKHRGLVFNSIEDEFENVWTRPACEVTGTDEGKERKEGRDKRKQYDDEAVYIRVQRLCA